MVLSANTIYAVVSAVVSAALGCISAVVCEGAFTDYNYTDKITCL